MDWKAVAAARTDFEDDLSREYRELARGIPVAGHLGDELAPAEMEAAPPRFYQYFDPTNEQIFLRMSGRISTATWLNWSEGIASNLRRPAYEHAWARVKQGRTASFAELRRLETSGFVDDPRSWLPLRERWWK